MGLAPTAAIRVRLDAGTITGYFVSATPAAIVLRVKGRDVPIDRISVRAIDRTDGKSHRGRNAAIGLFAGMGAGALLYRATCKSNCLAEGAVAWTVPLELVGVIAGAAAPAVKWETVYRR